MNALEKLGYKEKPCNFGKIFKKDDGTFRYEEFDLPTGFTHVFVERQNKNIQRKN